MSILKEEGVYEKRVFTAGHKLNKQEIALSNSGQFEEQTFNTVLVEENTVLIHFSFDETAFTKPDSLKLDSLVAELYRNKRLRLIMEGHTDEKGTKDYNIKLSEERVESVEKYLEKKGIPPGIIKSNAFGESRPRAGLEIVNRDALNRRVEIKVIELRR